MPAFSLVRSPSCFTAELRPADNALLPLTTQSIPAPAAVSGMIRVMRPDSVLRCRGELSGQAAASVPDLVPIIFGAESLDQ